MLVLFFVLPGCAPDLTDAANTKGDPCTVGGGAGALSTCRLPQQDPEYYVEQGLLYFDTLETGVDPSIRPEYADWVARWEWPPWLKLTGYGREDMEMADAIIRLLPTEVPERDCRAFAVAPFTRCRVNFYYEDYGDQPCPIYEEFTFNDAGQITFIEAWTDDPAFLPMADLEDSWGEGQTNRLSTRLPGLGNVEGKIDLDSPWMADAVAADADIADFVRRARDFYATWIEEYSSAGDAFARGCGF